jgi:hypothetical protein
MKTRNGFVSNSSTSSFIVTYKEEVKGELVGLYHDTNFGDLLDYHISCSRYSDISEMQARGRDEVLSYIDLRAADEYADATYWDKWKQHILELPADDIPMIFSMSYHDDMFKIALKAYCDQGYCVVIDEE